MPGGRPPGAGRDELKLSDANRPQIEALRFVPVNFLKMKRQNPAFVVFNKLLQLFFSFLEFGALQVFKEIMHLFGSSFTNNARAVADDDLP
jgi:hypothetical protein